MKTAPSSPSPYIQDGNDPFLTLFPHRFDYIYAPHPEPGETPDWQTESHYPLSDRVLHQGSYLYGVRFGSCTNYCLLDIDTSSVYHPQKDALAISRILAALESIGLVTYLACTSSYSSGIHLYFPFQQPQSSWELATVIATLLENAGFKLKPGQLEVFPNPKPYRVDGSPSLFNAHRLPMQAGSYLLSEEFQPRWSDRQQFVQQWRLVQSRNDLNAKTLKQILKQVKRKHYRVSGKADKFINDLNAEIELGWTGSGQTNHLLGRLTMRTYIFHHVLSGGEPLVGQDLVKEIVETARSLPGYQDWCRHQHEIEQRAEEWVRCIENSRYFRYGDQKGKYKTKIEAAAEATELELVSQLPTWNQQQAEGARERIRRAIADLLDNNSLPAAATARFQALTRCGIGGGSLYRHRDLWHPNYLVETVESVENPPDPPNAAIGLRPDCAEGASSLNCFTSLLSSADGNSMLDSACSDRTTQVSRSTGGNVPTNRANQDSSGSDWVVPGSVVPLSNDSVTFPDLKASIEAGQEAFKAARQEIDRIRDEAHQATYVARMQQYLESGDPILVAEARAWTQINLEVRPVEQQQAAWIESSPDVSWAAGKYSLCHSSLAAPDSDVFSDDLSELLAAISVQLRRLAWTKETAGDCLFSCFGKRKQVLLDEGELVQWLEWLQGQVRG